VRCAIFPIPSFLVSSTFLSYRFVLRIWNLGGIWTGISVTLGKTVDGKVSRMKGRDMKPVRLAVMQKVEFPNSYIKAEGNEVRIFVLFSLCALWCC